MEVRGNSVTQYGEQEKYIISLSPKSGQRTLQYTRDEFLHLVSFLALTL
jgi:hypothetical protein